MAKTNIVFWPNFKGLEDRVSLLEQAFPRTECIWYHDFQDFHFNDFGHAPNLDHEGAIVVINGAQVADRSMHQLNDSVRNFKYVVLISMGDEGSGQHLEFVLHPKLSIFVQDPKPGKHGRYHRLPSDSLPSATRYLPRFQDLPKTLDWFVSGSVRDVEWDKAIRELPRENAKLTGHLGSEEYMQSLCMAKVAICRPTLATPETCRVYDAMEAGAVPIVGMYPCEAVCEHCDQTEHHPHVHRWWEEYRYDWSVYWEYIFQEKPPFFVIESPYQLKEALYQTLKAWTPEKPRQIREWWLGQKKRIVDTLRTEVLRLQA